MSKRTKIWLIAAASLLIIGITLFAVTMAVNGWDFQRLNTAELETNTHEISEDFKDISIDSSTADIKFALSDDGKCRVVCDEFEKEKHTVRIENGTLKVALNEDKEWYEYIGFNLGSPEITIYLPRKEFGDLTIDLSTGDTEISKDFIFETVNISCTTGSVITKDVSAESVDISLSTGRIEISDLDCKGDLKLKSSTGDTELVNVNCKNLISTGTTGDLEMNKVSATDGFFIERSTGDVELEDCDAEEISIETDTGDVSGSLLTEKIFFVSTDTGDVEVPKSTSGVRCEITTDTGDVEIAIK